VWFEAADVRGVSKWSGGDKLPPAATLAPPVAWHDLRSLETQRSAANAGMLIGGIVLPISVYSAVAPKDHEGWAEAAALVCIPIGMLAGTLVGSLATDWKRV
jgi:hypothetical protein